MTKAKNPPLCALCGEAVTNTMRVLIHLDGPWMCWHWSCSAHDPETFDGLVTADDLIRIVESRGPGRVRREA